MYEPFNLYIYIYSTSQWKMSTQKKKPLRSTRRARKKKRIKEPKKNLKKKKMDETSVQVHMDIFVSSTNWVFPLSFLLILERKHMTPLFFFLVSFPTKYPLKVLSPCFLPPVLSLRVGSSYQNQLFATSWNESYQIRTKQKPSVECWLVKVICPVSSNSCMHACAQSKVS